MSHPVHTHATLGEWIAREAIRFSPDQPESLHAALDSALASLGDQVELLGFGEALHGGEDILLLRNRLFQHLVQRHGYSAIAIESSFPRARAVNEYIAGRGAPTYEAIQEAGFSHGFGRLDANRELIEWMRNYNASPAQRIKLRFYGADSPTEMTGTDSPRYVLRVVLDYLASIDGDGGGNGGQERRERIEALLGPDAEWENPAALMDPAQSIGASQAAVALRIETEELVSELQIRRPELVARSDADRYWEALQHAAVARQLLNYHAGLARASESRLIELLGIRDAMIADNLAYAVSRERGRGKVLAFAHNRHLQRGKAVWHMGPQVNIWWPAGAHLKELLGARYAVIGSGVGISEANGIGRPESGTLEALLTYSPDSGLLIPTHSGSGLPADEIAALAVRSGSARNSTYMALGPESFADFDYLLVLPSTAYSRGGPPLS
jgi:erythromycin esterase-like protein